MCEEEGKGIYWTKDAEWKRGRPHGPFMDAVKDQQRVDDRGGC